MSVVTRSSILALAATLSAHVALAQDIGQPGFVPLYDKKFPYNAIVSAYTALPGDMASYTFVACL